ncbi:radical SAM family heme chaperone HemW [Ornithinimicrobium humiphilum]|uniref:Heme chaperone HemW n=1 Tax=Ornithinimicrobium humiphilum TaxID=125288 RepID=A0A543KQ20_9MICO|nr:radical SAM family heme chaperone HemW [Ornithinimicrobium humiphilum]TQM97157.1 oxygen-independent coproporphyrinogen-3 oxidase [Ornithinimicrobium humiphilum]
MPSAFPPGDPAPADGSLPASALEGMPSRTFSVYVHVPFCRVRCGYCDFNTYTLPELGERPGDDGTPSAPTGLQGDYVRAAHAELDLAARVLAPGRPPAVSTIFLGGGTPTMLAPDVLGGLVAGVRDRWGLAPDAEVTTEANPDTLTPAVAEALAASGFTRVSIGMQSAVPHVLRTLDRTHDPANVASAVAAVRAAGLQVSLDLIYGTPGESLEDWRRSLEAVTALEPDHVSAYALVVEEGTRLAAQVRRGQVPAPSDDDEADKYELADELLSAAGYSWYEISNWSRGAATRCRHNVAYWRGGDWWGIGPGAHSHVGGLRWWNVKHPRAYAERLDAGLSPAHARELLGPEERHAETVLLGSRLGEGLPVEALSPAGRTAVAGLIADGLVQGPGALRGRVVLTRRGRLLADTVVHRLLPD